MIAKEKQDYTPEDISSTNKDGKVRHLLYSALEKIMCNRVIGCKTAKESWDALEVRCHGTNANQEKQENILTQEYEHFDSKYDGPLTNLYERFLKFLNNLSLVNKEYDLEDSNLKFMLALPKKWYLKATIRDNYDLEEMSLDEIYKMLKTHELEIKQRSKRHGVKSKSIASKDEEKTPEEASIKKIHFKGNTLISKYDNESSNYDDDSNSENPLDSDDDDDDDDDSGSEMM